MKKQKTYVAMLLAALVILSLAGCGMKNSKDNAETTTGWSVENPDNTTKDKKTTESTDAEDNIEEDADGIMDNLGAGTFFNIKIFGDWFTPITIFIMAPGAFLVLGFLVAGMNIIRKKMEAKGTPLAEPAGCLSGDCAHCGASCPSAKAAQAAVEPNTTEGGDK